MKEEDTNTEVVQNVEPVQTNTEQTQASGEPTQQKRFSLKYIFIFCGIILIVLIVFFVVKGKLDKKEGNLTNHDGQNTTAYEFSCTKENIYKYGNDSANEFSNDDLYIEGITLGMSRKDVISKLGKNYTENWDDNSILGRLIYAGMDLDFFRIKNDDETAIIGEELKRINIKNDTIVTSRGIKIGSSVDELLNAYKKENISAYRKVRTDIEDGDICFDYNISNINEIETIAVNEDGKVSSSENFSNTIQFDIENGIVSHIKIWNG